MTDSAGTPGLARTANGGVPLILLAMLFFAVQDVLVKLMASDVSLWQFQAVRSVAVVTLVVAFAVFAGRVTLLAPGALGWPLARAGFMAGAYLLFYASLPVLPLSQAAAALYAGPLAITLLAALLLGEPIGWRRLSAVLLGFAGVLAIIRPWAEDWQPAILLPVGAALAYAMGVIVTRARCHDRSGVSLTLTHNLIFAGVGMVALVVVPLLPLSPDQRSAAPFVLNGWQALGVLPLLMILGTACTHLLGALAMTQAYQTNEASRLAPFEYAYLAIVPVFDIAIWGRAPDAWTVAGMVLIVLGGSVVARAEGRPARPTARPARSRPWTDAADPGRKGG